MPNNTVPVSFNLTGLIKRQNYEFSIEGLGGNWPATITPTSGTFTASSKSGIIDATVSFCATTGSCLGDTDILPYDLTKKCTFDNSQIFTFVLMKASLIEDPSIYVYSDPIRVVCDSCLPDASITMPPSIILSESTSNAYEFTASINGLIPKEKYIFNYSSIDANWPVKIYPKSGIISSSSVSYSIPTKIVFCNSTGVCPSEDENVLDYVADASCLTTSTSFFSEIKLNLQPLSCDYDSADSNILNIRCLGCLPKPVVGIPYEIKLNNQTNNYANFTAIVSGITPNKNYSYSYRTLDANWPIHMDNTTGLFSSPTNKYCIDSKIEFCESTGLCTPGSYNVLEHSFADSCFTELREYQGRIILEISSVDCEDVLINSNIMTFSCDHCFPPVTEVKVPDQKLILGIGEMSNFTTNITNLKPETLYSYKIESLYSDWPIFVYKPSGYIQNLTDSYSIDTEVVFCSSTGVCQQGYEGVLDYTLNTNNNYVEEYINKFKNYAILQVSVFEDNCPTKTYVSKKLFVECSGCEIVTPPSVISLIGVNVT